jgi:CheY-like chemotaxis protein
VKQNPARILIAEDNDGWRGVLAMALRAFGYQVVEARTGVEAVEQSSQTRPDLILMDLGLPGMTGEEAIACLKANPTTRDIPVIVQTAFSPGVHTTRATQAGAAEILHKPLKLDAIRAILQKHLSRSTPSTDVVGGSVPSQTPERNNAQSKTNPTPTTFT